MLLGKYPNYIFIGLATVNLSFQNGSGWLTGIMPSRFNLSSPRNYQINSTIRAAQDEVCLGSLLGQ